MRSTVMRETLRRFDRHRRQLLISELGRRLRPHLPARVQIGLTECQRDLETIVNRCPPLDDTPRRLPDLRCGIISRRP